MAAVTESARRDYVAGNFRMVKARLSFESGDEWVPGLDTIEHVDFTPTTATAFGVVVSGRTATFVGVVDEVGDAIATGT